MYSTESVAKSATRSPFSTPHDRSDVAMRFTRAFVSANVYSARVGCERDPVGEVPGADPKPVRRPGALERPDVRDDLAHSFGRTSVPSSSIERITFSWGMS